MQPAKSSYKSDLSWSPAKNNLILSLNVPSKTQLSGSAFRSRLSSFGSCAKAVQAGRQIGHVVSSSSGSQVSPGYSMKQRTQSLLLPCPDGGCHCGLVGEQRVLRVQADAGKWDKSWRYS